MNVYNIQYYCARVCSYVFLFLIRPTQPEFNDTHTYTHQGNCFGNVQPNGEPELIGTEKK